MQQFFIKLNPHLHTRQRIDAVKNEARKDPKQLMRLGAFTGHRFPKYIVQFHKIPHKLK